MFLSSEVGVQARPFRKILLHYFFGLYAKFYFQKAVFINLSRRARIIFRFNFKTLFWQYMYSSFYTFLTEYKLLFKKQFGFWNNHSTNHALISLIDLIKKYLDNDYFVCGVFIDLQKAFNTVNHEILLVKLDFYGICELAN